METSFESLRIRWLLQIFVTQYARFIPKHDLTIDL